MTGDILTIQSDLLGDIAAAAGLAWVGWTGVTPVAESASALRLWQERGFAASMEYMRRPADMLADPARLLEGARSLVSFAVPYSAALRPPRPPGSGKVARYAWGLDYHRVLPARLASFLEGVREALGRTPRARVASDAVPLLERPLAERGGLGFVGNNTLLIRPGSGSLFFLAEIIWDVVIESPPPTIGRGTCGTCTRCLRACPTNAFPAPGILDAGRCISYLTIEHRGAFDDWQRRAIGEWIFGCDVCQEVCPFNHAALKASSPGLTEFAAGDGVGPWLDLAEVLEIPSNRAFERRFHGTALLRARRQGLRRNACVVAANTGHVALAPLLTRIAAGDNDAVVRQHALWALKELAERWGADRTSVARALDVALRDPAEPVREEARRCIAAVRSA